ncbi:MAG: hypothetical protein ACO3RV_07655, partial [Luteolibacter sp.]
MDLIHSWMDTEAVRRLANKLVSPSDSQPGASLDSCGFGNDFVGFGADLSGSGENSPSGSARFQSEEFCKPASSPSSNETLSWSARLGLLRDWGTRLPEVLAMFLLNQTGEVLLDEGGEGELHAIARSFVGQAPESGDGDDFVWVRMTRGASLLLVRIVAPS